VAEITQNIISHGLSHQRPTTLFVGDFIGWR